MPALSHADTIDVWMIKRNGARIMNSNQLEITYQNKPMKVHLSEFADTDTLQVLMWTDTHKETEKWFYTIKDSNGVILERFENPIDSSVQCFPSPCKTFTERKNYIAFSVSYLKELIKSKNVNGVMVEFEFEDKKWTDSYVNKPVCIFSKD